MVDLRKHVNILARVPLKNRGICVAEVGGRAEGNLEIKMGPTQLPIMLVKMRG